MREALLRWDAGMSSSSLLMWYDAQIWKAKDFFDRDGQLWADPEADWLQQLPTQTPEQIWRQWWYDKTDQEDI